MNLITTAVGLLVCVYAIWVFVMRLQGKEHLFRKLEPMRKFWGPRLGSSIHYIGYVIVPFVVGVSIIIAGLNGMNLLALLK